MKTLPQAFHRGMRELFGITDAGRFMDLVFVQLHEVKLDVLAFDDWLHEKHGQYEDDGLSMREAIAKHYSEAAAAFVESLL